MGVLSQHPQVHPQSGYHQAPKVAKNTDRARMAENHRKITQCSSHSTHTNHMESGANNTFLARNKKSKRFVIFNRKNVGSFCRHFLTPPKKSGFQVGGGGGLLRVWTKNSLGDAFIGQNKPTIQRLEVGYANRPKNGGYVVFSHTHPNLRSLIEQPLRGDFENFSLTHANLETAKSSPARAHRGADQGYPGFGLRPPPLVGVPCTRKKLFRTRVCIDAQGPQYAKKFQTPDPPTPTHPSQKSGTWMQGVGGVKIKKLIAGSFCLPE